MLNNVFWVNIFTNNVSEQSTPASGVPIYIGSGSHIFLNKKYRFMIIPRYRVDLNYLLQRNKVSIKNILIIAIQILDILEYIHFNGFAHSDIKAQNLMIGVEKKFNIVNNNGENSYINCTDSFRIKTPRMYNPLRKCKISSIFEAPIQRVLRTKSKINYCEENSDTDGAESYATSDDDFNEYLEDLDDVFENTNKTWEKERVFLIDYGLASKFVDPSGSHRAFYVDERRAHDGTLEYTSRDAHFGAHSRRSDLECLGYNLLDWITGDLPWKEENILSQPEIVHRMKICFMNNVGQMMNYCYKGKYPNFIRKYLEYVCTIDYTEDPDYDYCRNIFLNEYKQLGFSLQDMNLNFENINNGLDDFKCFSEKPSLLNLAANNSLSMLISNESSIKRLSPKNLRSKQLDSHLSPMKLRNKGSKKSLTWNDILCNQAEDLLQITLDEMTSGDEVDSNLSNNEYCIKYEGKPTYAIRLVLKSIKEVKSNKKLKTDERKSTEVVSESDGLTYAMRLVLEKKNIRDNKENINKAKQVIKSNNTKVTKRNSKIISKQTKPLVNNDVEGNENFDKNSKSGTEVDVNDICDFRLRSNRKRSSLIYTKNRKR